MTTFVYARGDNYHTAAANLMTTLVYAREDNHNIAAANLMTTSVYVGEIIIIKQQTL